MDHCDFSTEFVNDMDSLLNDHDPDIVAPFFSSFQSVSPTPSASFPEYTNLAPMPSSSQRAQYDPQDALTSLMLSPNFSVYPDAQLVLGLQSPWSTSTHRTLAPEMSIQPERLSMGDLESESAVDTLFFSQEPSSVPLSVQPNVPLRLFKPPRPLETALVTREPMELFPLFHPPLECHTSFHPPPHPPHLPPRHHGDWVDYRRERRGSVPVSPSEFPHHHHCVPWIPHPTDTMPISVSPRPNGRLGWDMYDCPREPWSPADPSHRRGRSLHSHEAPPSPRSAVSEPTKPSSKRRRRPSTSPSTSPRRETTKRTRSRGSSVSSTQTSSPHRKRTKRVSPAPEDKYCNYTRWMAVETASLMRLVRQQDQDNIQWDQIAEDLGTERSPSQCQNKWNAEIAKLDPNKDDEEKFIKGRWSPQEDQALQHGVERYLRSNGMMPQPPAFLPDEENEARPVETGAPVTRDQDETSELFNSLVDNHLYDDSGPDVSSAADLTHSKVLHQLQLFSSMSSASSSCSPYHSSPSSPSSYTTSSSTPPRPFRNTSGVRSSPPVFRTRQDYENEVSRLMVRCPWGLIVKSIDGRSGIQAQARWSEALDPQVRRGKWSLREDRLLFEGVEKHARCWIRIADGIPGRTQRQCRTRWVQLRTKGEREQAEAMALALRKEQEKMMKEKKNEEEEEEEEEVTRGMKKVMIRKKGGDVVLGRRFP
ncbi:hypothetical protein MVEG_06073 [Podila verticillata NRRL 6337]|nr:hypothetical protein MVEG_06073 [Podila verticillata NRRL 6337]